ncbi:MAG TPA: hypothetical protein VHU77_04310, partial [Candidatus Limnocylindria bacterium]|nr:hypothetical protein [Candidatus Limnocylindria bacterium]
GMPAVHAPAPPRAMAVSLCGWSWAALALLEGAYAVYLGSGALANGGSQETWILTVGFAVLTVFGGRLARGILLGPSRRLLHVSLAAAGGHVLFAIRGLFLSGPVQPFIVLGAMAAVIMLISWLAMRDMPD